MKNQRIIGILLALIGGSLWGLNGTVSQYLFQHQGIDVNWFVTARLIGAGIILLAIQCIRKKPIFTVWKNAKFRWQLLLFSIVGMLGVQYSYMASISYGNSAVATLLQYLAPIFIVFYLIMTKQQPFLKLDALLIIATLFGSWLLLTDGQIGSFSVSTSAIIWGIISALTLAFYTLYAKTLLAHFSALVVIGWAMLIAGLVMNFIHPIWTVESSLFNINTNIALFFTIFFGTAIAFWFFFQSVGYLSAKETVLLGTVEPLMAILSSVIWLALPFSWIQAIGAAFILGVVLIISLIPKKTTL
ncbi:DMT family transporter [Kurthia senegalensis]|uniref:DMT family transporter n=1 Tax=Kurthia senegalensis TaxID=1033740 RepID=UPI000288E05C|nr:DMT family transporter [Kurthia senegalensis]